MKKNRKEKKGMEQNRKYNTEERNSAEHSRKEHKRIQQHMTID